MEGEKNIERGKDFWLVGNSFSLCSGIHVFYTRNYANGVAPNISYI